MWFLKLIHIKTNCTKTIAKKYIFNEFISASNAYIKSKKSKTGEDWLTKNL
jgi:hypothetical protein